MDHTALICSWADTHQGHTNPSQLDGSLRTISAKIPDTPVSLFSHYIPVCKYFQVHFWYFPFQGKNAYFSSSHLNLLDLPHDFFYLINISFFSAKRKQDITLNVQTQILEIHPSDTQNTIVLFSSLKLCLLEQLHYYFYFILYFYKYIIYFKGKERLVVETVFIKSPYKYH